MGPQRHLAHVITLLVLGISTCFVVGLVLTSMAFNDVLSHSGAVLGFER
jgi:hypothetical protein